MINLQTLLSSFDDKGTLMLWLKAVERALANASLSTVQLITLSDEQIKLSFVFADGTSVVSPAITLPRGATGATGANGKDGKDGTNGTNGTNGADGVGISSITKTGVSGLVDTYTITYTNGATSTFTVTNGANGEDGTSVRILPNAEACTRLGDGYIDASGHLQVLTSLSPRTFTDAGLIKGEKGDTGNGIASITKTGTSGLVDTYTITYTNGATTTFTVTNGANGTNGVGISSITKTGTSGLVDTYTITYTDNTTDTFTVTNGANGTNGTNGADGVGISSITKTGTSGLVDTYTITYTDSTTDTFTVTNGANGTNGQGVPTGGTTGQALCKKSNTDYDTEWKSIGGGGGTQLYKHTLSIASGVEGVAISTRSSAYTNADMIELFNAICLIINDYRIVGYTDMGHDEFDIYYIENGQINTISIEGVYYVADTVTAL